MTYDEYHYEGAKRPLTKAEYHAALEAERAEKKETAQRSTISLAGLDTRSDKEKHLHDVSKGFLRELTQNRAAERREQQDSLCYLAQKAITKESGFEERYQQQQDEKRPYRELLKSIYKKR